MAKDFDVGAEEFITLILVTGQINQTVKVVPDDFGTGFCGQNKKRLSIHTKLQEIDESQYGRKGLFGYKNVLRSLTALGPSAIRAIPRTTHFTLLRVQSRAPLFSTVQKWYSSQVDRQFTEVLSKEIKQEKENIYDSSPPKGFSVEKSEGTEILLRKEYSDGVCVEIEVDLAGSVNPEFDEAEDELSEKKEEAPTLEARPDIRIRLVKPAGRSVIFNCSFPSGATRQQASSENSNIRTLEVVGNHLLIVLPRLIRFDKMQLLPVDSRSAIELSAPKRIFQESPNNHCLQVQTFEPDFRVKGSSSRYQTPFFRFGNRARVALRPSNLRHTPDDGSSETEKKRLCRDLSRLLRLIDYRQRQIRENRLGRGCIDCIFTLSRLCAVRLATSVKESHKRDVDRCLFIVSAYAPTDCSSDAVRERFYDALNALLRRAKSSDIVLVAGDLNAQVGRLSVSETQLGGRHGLDSTTETFVDTKSIPVLRKQVLPRTAQFENESRRLWEQVTRNLKSGDIDAATDAKFRLEQKQRDLARHRQENKIQWIPEYFRGEGGNWIYRAPLVQRLADRCNSNTTGHLTVEDSGRYFCSSASGSELIDNIPLPQPTLLSEQLS
ncbi:oxysterol-binding protein-related protein 9 [Clonorchis sinensis]|uniref:Oxysterol-binding protein-related protein 9 n=1 Tax=Clonorchis sinensis TaxID=79923 RepID=G7YVD0_CLOSI|nr:oxysterol-binding protein-related protein 9 [Clonorchis sinensis]